MILEAAGSAAALVRVPDELLPEDLAESGTVSQHILASSARARAMLGWSSSDPRQSLGVTVRWHLEHPPADAGSDFAADDIALAAVKA